MEETLNELSGDLFLDELEEDEKRAKKKKGFFAQTPSWIFQKCYEKEISPGAVVFYGHLGWRYGGYKLIYPKQDTLADEMGTSPASIQRWTAELRKVGAITSGRRNRARGGNYYMRHWFPPESKFRKPESVIRKIVEEFV